MDRFDPFVKYADVYGDIINWEKDPMNKPQNQNKYFFSDGKTYYEQICKMLRLMSVFKEAFNQIYSNEDEISEAWENFVNNLSASVVEGSEPDVTLTWTDDSVNFEFTMVPGAPGEQGVGITSISFNSNYTMTITLSDGNTYTSMSLKGETGPQGPQGETGSGLQILDVYATLADLQSAHPTGQPGDAYQVGSGGNYILYIWSSSQSAWIQAGTLGTVSPSVSNPLMDGTASAGSLNQYSRGDHVHPSDTSRASKEELDALIKTSQALIDQSFTYRESPAIQDGLARIDKIKGNTLMFNQLIENGNFASTSKWNTQQSATQSASNNVMTVTCETDNGHTVNIFSNVPAGHKCLISCECKTASANARAIMAYCGNYTDSSAQITLRSSSTNWERLTGIVTSASGNVFQFRLYADSATNQFRNAMLIDLTQMFGAGKEPTVEQFNSLFPLPYYSYQSTLLPFKGTSIKTVGKNLIDTSAIEQGSLDAATGNPIASSTRVRTPFIELSEGSYTITSSNGFYVVVYAYDSQQVFNASASTTSWTHAQFTFSLPFNGYVRVAFRKSDNSNITPNQINGEWMYNNNTESVTSLPTLTYFPNGMKSAGTVYDELLPNKAITRVGMVDLGSLTWTLQNTTTGNWRFNSSIINDLVLPSSTQVVSNLTCSRYVSVSPNAIWTGTKGIAIDNSMKRLFACDSAYSTADAFASAMSGVYLYYELATPTETAVDPDLDFRAYEKGTEQLLPVNGSVPSTSPIIADMTYLSIDDAMEYVLEKLANVPQNTQQILESLEDDVADLQTDVGALQPAVSALQTSVGNINTNIGQLSSTVAGHTSSISDIQSDISDLNTGLSNLEDTVTDDTSRIGTLETDLASTDGQVQNLTTSVSGLDSTVTAQGETVTALDNFVSNIANNRNPGYMSSDNSIGITSAFLNMTLAAGQSTWANIPLPTIMAGFIPLFVVGAATGDGSVCLFKIPSTYNKNNIYRVGVKNTSNSEVTTQVSIEILCIKQRQSQ